MPWKDFLYYTNSERNGIKILLLLIMLALFAPAIYQGIAPEPYKDTSEFETQVRAFEKLLAKKHLATSNEATTNKKTTSHTRTEEAITLSPFPFNPNDLPGSGWKKMGLPDYFIRTVTNYKNAGGTFRFREDLLRIYLMKEEWYEVLEPFIKLPLRGEATKSNRHATEESEIRPSHTNSFVDTLATDKRLAASSTSTTESQLLIVDINSADTLEFMKLRGIGSVFSKRIVGYRELLGGFLHIDQLLEVYGMDTTRLNQIKENLHFDAQNVHRINLNDADFVTLVRHPYIDRDLANALLSFRDQHHPLDSLSQLRRSYLITDEAYDRIETYLKLK